MIVLYVEDGVGIWYLISIASLSRGYDGYKFCQRLILQREYGLFTKAQYSGLAEASGELRRRVHMFPQTLTAQVLQAKQLGNSSSPGAGP